MDLTKEELSELNLEAEDIFIHQSRITSYNPSDSSIPILDTCRMDNGGVFPESFEVSSPLVEGDPKAIGFVPSAGAASRYFAPLADLREALQNKSSEELASARAQLKEQGATSWPLPELVKELIQSSSQPSDEMAEKILQIISLPKGLLPATTDKATFLEAKLMEHESITGISGQVFVVKPEKREIFEEVCASYPSKIPAAFLEQGPKFSTIRFNEDGTPYRDSEDRVSIVPAGHGTLVKLFTDAGKKFPNADFLLIRNIDNVMGTSKEILAATEKFLKRHHQILQLVKGIRKNLAARDLDKASEFANEILRFDVTTHPSEMQLAFIEKQGQELKGLWKAYITLFSPPDCAIDESRDSCLAVRLRAGATQQYSGWKTLSMTQINRQSRRFVLPTGFDTSRPAQAGFDVSPVG